MKRHSSAEHPWVGHVRHFSDALTEIISSIERVTVRLLKFAGALYALYKMFIHH